MIPKNVFSSTDRGQVFSVSVQCADNRQQFDCDFDPPRHQGLSRGTPRGMVCRSIELVSPNGKAEEWVSVPTGAPVCSFLTFSFDGKKRRGAIMLDDLMEVDFWLVSIRLQAQIVKML